VNVSKDYDCILLEGMAIQMALDLGLNVSSERWIRKGSTLFSERDRELRACIWFGCVQLDK
jgi:hypothetical protein